MNGAIVVPIVLAVVCVVMLVTHYVPEWLAEQRMRRSAPVADWQRWRRENAYTLPGYTRHLYDELAQPKSSAVERLRK